MKKTIKAIGMLALIVALIFGALLLSGGAAARVSASHGAGSPVVLTYPSPDPHP